MYARCTVWSMGKNKFSTYYKDIKAILEVKTSGFNTYVLFLHGMYNLQIDY